MRNMMLLAASLSTLISACDVAAPPAPPANPSGEGDGPTSPGPDEPGRTATPPDEVPPVWEPVDVSTSGCSVARWCADIEGGGQFASQVELLDCGASCSIHEPGGPVEGCLLTFSGAVGVALEGSYPAAFLAFGSVGVGDVREHIVRVENQGTADCPIDSVGLAPGRLDPTPSSFSLTGAAVSALGPGEAVDLTVRFAPQQAQGLEAPYLDVVVAGAHSMVDVSGVSTAADDASCRLQVDTGHAGGVTLSASVGGGQGVMLTITAVGGGGCRLLATEVTAEGFSAAPAASGLFEQADGPSPAGVTSFVAYPSSLPLDVSGGVLAPGEHVSLDVDFSAATLGTTQGVLVIRAQGADDVSVPLTGTGTPPPPLCTCEHNFGGGCRRNDTCS